MKHTFFAIITIALVLTSCKNNDTAVDQIDQRTVVPFTQQASSGIQNQTEPVATAQDHNLFHEKNATATPSVLEGINPAHGQPNHRCDIAVGEPLNSSANGVAPTQDTNVQPTQMVTTTQAAVAKTVTPKGMNPPHGEKNHRCDIAVGAPLNTKTAVANSASAGQYTQQVNVPQPLPALLSTNSTDGETPAGMNPPHGKDGHRCDIAVGAALPKS